MLKPEPQIVVDGARERFLDAAAELFAEKGYHATSIRDIARHLGVTPGAVYAHFPSKSQLLLAVYEAGVARMSACLEDVDDADPDPWSRLETACRRHLETLLQAGGYGRVVIRVLPSDVAEVADAMARLREDYEKRFREYVDALDLAPETDRRIFRLTILGALNWSLVWYREGATSPAAIARQLVDGLRAGYSAKQGS